MSVVHMSTRYGVAKKSAKAEPNYNILIVDDDPNFRNLAEAILAGRGYKVWHAKSGDEALSYLDTAEPALVIVDYRLPGMDGIEWIKIIRERGYNVPTVLCTGAWIDPTTFKWIRNMLRVSLVIQKPIVPQLFLHSIEAILPAPCLDNEESGGRVCSGGVYSAIAPVLKKDEKSTPAEILQALDEAIAKETDAQRKSDLQDVRKRTATQHRLAEARRQFIEALPGIWADFSESAGKACDEGDLAAAQAARQDAHRMCGTVGSFGLVNLSTVCGKLETLFASFDPNSPTMNQLIIAEIERCMTEGEHLLQAALRSEPAATPEGRTERPFTLLVVVPEESSCVQSMITIALQHRVLQVEFAHTALGAHVKCKNNRYDAVIVDSSVGTSDMELAKDLRAIPGYLRLPFAFIANEFAYDGHLRYAGSSLTISADASLEELTEAVAFLRRASDSRKPRVLLVDDDNELTNFVEALLSDEGYVVCSLNEPIHTLEVAQEFKPDLILVDAVMPGINGFDVCRALKTHECTAATPVLFLTATSDASSRSCAFQAGAEDFVTKPIVLDELIARTKKYLPCVVDRLGSGGSALIERALFMTTVNHYIAERENGGTVFLIAIDDPGMLDARHGPLACDHVSTMLARLASLRFRPSDLRTQLDRERFAIFAPDMTEGEAAKVREAICSEVSNMSFASSNGGNFIPSISVHSAQVGSNNELHG